MSGRRALRKSSVEEKACTFNSTERHRLVRQDRTWLSSSMMNTIELGSLMVLFQQEVRKMAAADRMMRQCRLVLQPRALARLLSDIPVWIRPRPNWSRQSEH